MLQDIILSAAKPNRDKCAFDGKWRGFPLRNLSREVDKSFVDGLSAIKRVGTMISRIIPKLRTGGSVLSPACKRAAFPSALK